MTKWLLTVTLIVGIAPTAFAQRSVEDKTVVLLGVMGSLFGPSVNSTINAGSVKADIQLTPEQDQKIKQLRKDVMAELKQQKPELFGDKKKGLSQMNEIQKVLNERIPKLLKPEQHKRLLQIILQLQEHNQGLIMVFANKQMRETLQFTDAQEKEFLALKKEFDAVFSQVTRSRNPGSIKSTMDAFHAKTNPRILALLDKEQTTLWQQIHGKQFDFTNNQDLPIRR